MSHFVCAAILKFKDFFTKTGTYTFSSCGSWTLFTNPAETLTMRFTSKGKEFLDLDFLLTIFFIDHFILYFKAKRIHFPDWFSDVDKNDFYWLDFLSQLLPYVLTSFAWCGTWGAPLALIQLGLGWWSVSMVSVLGVAWWGVYQQGWLSIHMLFWFAASLLTVCPLRS